MGVANWRIILFFLKGFKMKDLVKDSTAVDERKYEPVDGAVTFFVCESDEGNDMFDIYSIDGDGEKNVIVCAKGKEGSEQLRATVALAYSKGYCDACYKVAKETHSKLVQVLSDNAKGVTEVLYTAIPSEFHCEIDQMKKK